MIGKSNKHKAQNTMSSCVEPLLYDITANPMINMITIKSWEQVQAWNWLQSAKRNPCWHVEELTDLKFLYRLYNKESYPLPCYIGQTANPHKRISYHINENSKNLGIPPMFEIETYRSDDINYIETFEIIIYRPKYNFSLPKNNWFVNLFDIYALCKENNIKRNIKPILDNTRSFIVGSTKYWLLSDFYSIIYHKLWIDCGEQQCLK